MLKGIGTRIKDLREEHELTMDMLVQDINSRYELENPLNKGMVSRWERDINNPSLDSARCLCDYFNVSLDYLIGNTDVRTPVRLMTYAKKFQEMKGTNK
jgi:transcriptional regulator with XRE-family HTH domain